MVGEYYPPVVEIPLAKRNGTTEFSLVNAEVKQFRFLHTSSLFESNIIRIVTTEQTLPQNYACLSYVWDGLEPDPEDAVAARIYVKGLDPKKERDLTSAAILKNICNIARKLGCELLWFDKFCMRQDTDSNDKTTIGWVDKNWQMTRMYEIYARCRVCLVAPGGLNRLPEISERTSYIERAWTLQESLAPRDVRVLFKWIEGPSILQHIGYVEVEQVTKNVGMSQFRGLLEASLRSDVKTVRKGGGNRGIFTPVEMFRKQNEISYPVLALLSAMDPRDRNGILAAIWRCLIIRSAKYKEDMILSSMGIMGAVVSPSPHDKDAAGYKEVEEAETYALLIRFVQELARQNNGAKWLGFAPRLGPSSKHTGLPALPLKSNVGSGFVEVPGKYGRIVKPNLALDEGSHDGLWWLNYCPPAQVFDNGDISLRTRYAPVEESEDTKEYKGYILQRETPTRLVNCSTYRAWDIKYNVVDTEAFAVYIGFKTQYRNGVLPVMVDPTSSLLMLIKEVEEGKYKNFGYAWAADHLHDHWPERSFTVV